MRIATIATHRLKKPWKAFDRLGQSRQSAGHRRQQSFPVAHRGSEQVSRAHQWTEYSVVEQRYTYLRPRHGADFGPQIFISEDLKDYARVMGSR